MSQHVYSQKDINGIIVSDTSNFRIIKVWGNHYERGYALGYLDGDRMLNLYKNYIIPALSQQGVDTLKKYIQEEKHFVIQQKYHIEAEGMVEGIIDAGHSAEDLNKYDILAANTFFDFIGFISKEKNSSFGCSSLMNWGDATLGTDLNGASVISRHVDWTPNIHLINSSSVVAHIPQEEDEQAWIMIGFAGQMSALSGINSSSLAVFHHSLSDFYGTALKNKVYEPVWFTTRNALEVMDYNSDNVTNTNDLRDAVAQNISGYANGSILCAVSNTDITFDSLTAIVIESACFEPYHTYRYNDFDDLIPGDNLYAANSSVKRNDMHNYEPRYMNIVNNIGDGTLIDDDINWTLMKEYSNSSSHNIQFMQYIPNRNILNISVADIDHYAYQKEPVSIYIDTLFVIPAVNKVEDKESEIFRIFPNPVLKNKKVNIEIDGMDCNSVQIIDVQGKFIEEMNVSEFKNKIQLNLDLERGVYFIRFCNKNNLKLKKLIVL